ncbi:helix-turn-helix domain-containing protein [Metamycoplasma hominis]
MIEEHICDMKHVKIHGNDFTDEIKYYLKMFSMTQKELSIRLGLSIKHINSIMNNEVNNVSATIIEALEYAFHLEIGTLTEVYHIYNNLKTLKKNKNIEDDLKKHGIDFLINHPELALAANISIHENSPLHVKLIMLKDFLVLPTWLTMINI